MADNSKDPEYQEYQEYLEYLNHVQGQSQSPASPAPSPAPSPSFKDKLGEGHPLLQQQIQAVDKGTSPEGMQDIASRTLLPASAAKLAQGAGALGRIGIGAAQGATMGGIDTSKSPQDRLEGAAKGGLAGGVLSGLGEAAGAGFNALNSMARKAARFTPSQAEAYTSNPAEVKEMAGMIDDHNKLPELQNKAVEAMNESRKSLKAKGLQSAGKLKELLTGKSVSIEPADYQGTDPEIDRMIEQATPSPYGQTPLKMDVDANRANDMKRILQGKAQFQQGSVTDPVQQAKMAGYAQKASGLRAGIEQAGGPEVGDLNKSMQEGLLLQQALRKGAKSSPLAFLSSESPDRAATLMRAEQASGGSGDLAKFGAKYGAAKSMANKDTDDAISRQIEKALGRTALRGLSTVPDSNPELNALLKSIAAKKVSEP